MESNYYILMFQISQVPYMQVKWNIDYWCSNAIVTFHKHTLAGSNQKQQYLQTLYEATYCTWSARFAHNYFFW